MSKNIYYERKKITISCQNIGEVNASPVFPNAEPLLIC